jgi:hypothetical protein
MYREETNAIALDQKVIPSNYLERPDFSFSSPLHSALHYVFIRGVRMVTNSQGYRLRKGINKFLDFANEYNSQVPPALQIKTLNDVGVSEYSTFEDYLLRNKVGVDSAVRLSASLRLVAREFDDGMPQLRFHRISMPEWKPAEPLSLEADNDFYTAMYRDLDLITDKVRFQAEVKTAQPYCKSEVNDICGALYSMKRGERSDWTIDPLRAATTLDHAGYPFYTSARAIQCMELDARTNAISSTGRTPEEFVLSCCANLGFLRRRAPGCIALSDLFRLMYPTAQDHATLALFIQRQLGWNKEVVLSIDRVNFVHPISELAKDDSVLLISDKLRSQNQGKPFSKPKPMFATSSRSDKYSAYNLILLANRLSDSCRNLLNLDATIEADDVRHRSPFLFLECPQVPWTVNERIQSLDKRGHWLAGVSGFLEGAKIYDNGALLSTAADLQGRLRVTSIQMIKNSTGHSLAMTALIHGHASAVTTETHYDSSVFAMAERKKRFHSFQEELIRKRQLVKFQGTLNNRGKGDVLPPKFRIFTLLGHERPLWACKDSRKPSYPGSHPLSAGGVCTRLDKCNGCKNWVVLNDSLPFLLERLATLEIQVERDPDFHSQYVDEINILRYVLDNWGNNQALELARVYMSKYEVLLPLDLHSLISYIED